MRDLLIEIGTEELPASFVPLGITQLRDGVLRFLKEQRIPHGPHKTYGTPRRLALWVREVAERQETWETEVLGPPAHVAFDAEGNPTRAAEGFARSRGVRVKDLKVVQTEKGAYVAAVIREGGKETRPLLQDALPQIIADIRFPKSMRWNGPFRFGRPIRWLLALFGEEVLDLEVAGVRAGRITRGHRLISPDPIEIPRPNDYEALLEAHGVIADPERRKKLLWERIRAAAEAVGGKPVEDEELLDEVVHLVEVPAAVLGSFPETYLQLPEPVVITAMKQHQRYFAVFSPEGKLLPYFVAAINNREVYADRIRPGLERVLRARLEDARFYFQEDTRRPLRERVEELKGIVWREGLGSMYDKVLRVRDLALKLAERDPEVDREVLSLGAFLAKVDLVTEMIRDGKEFTKLEGIIGMEYALHQGEDPRVARIIFEHHLPRFPGDRLPSQKESAYVGIADRLDTLVGILSTGYEPRGSQDPLGLRRVAYGLIELVLSSGIRLDLEAALKEAARPFGDGKLVEGALQFLLARFENYLEERLGIRYDLVDCVIASGVRDLVNLRKRAEALKALMEEDPETFRRVVVGQKRVANILEKAEQLPPPNPHLFEKPEEGDLYEAALKVRPRVEKAIQQERFTEALHALLELRQPIDRFFDHVFVMVEDLKLRNNRLSLLSLVRSIFRLYGDFSKIVVEGE